LIITRRQDHPPLKGIVTADRLRAHAPPIATLPNHALPALLGVKEGDQGLGFQHVQEAEPAGRVTYDERHDRAAGGSHRCRFVNARPLNAANVDVRVHGIAYGEMGDGKGQHCSGVTALRVSPRHVLHLMRGGRARWTMAHATFHTLQNPGSHFEHNDGHGEQPLSVVLAMGMRRAFLVDQPQPLGWVVCRAVWTTLGSQRLLWERMRALCDAYALQAMRQRLATRLYGLQKLQPLWAVESS
jgi:hypothetical protein